MQPLTNPDQLELRRRLIDYVKAAQVARKKSGLMTTSLDVAFKRNAVLGFLVRIWIDPLKGKVFRPLFQRWLRKLNDQELDDLIELSHGRAVANQVAVQAQETALLTQLRRACDKWVQRDITGKALPDAIYGKPKNDAPLIKHIRERLGPGGAQFVTSTCTIYMNIEQPRDTVIGMLDMDLSECLEEVRNKRMKNVSIAKAAANNPVPLPKKQRVLL